MVDNDTLQFNLTEKNVSFINIFFQYKATFVYTAYMMSAYQDVINI